MEDIAIKVSQKVEQIFNEKKNREVVNKIKETAQYLNNVRKQSGRKH